MEESTFDVVCSYCHKKPLKKLACSRCKSRQYCDRECQKKGWKTHKQCCYDIKKLSFILEKCHGGMGYEAYGTRFIIITSATARAKEILDQEVQEIFSNVNPRTISPVFIKEMGNLVKLIMWFDKYPNFIFYVACDLFDLKDRKNLMNYAQTAMSVACYGAKNNLLKQVHLFSKIVCNACSSEVTGNDRDCKRCELISYCSEACENAHREIHAMYCRTDPEITGFVKKAQALISYDTGLIVYFTSKIGEAEVHKVIQNIFREEIPTSALILHNGNVNATGACVATLLFNYDPEILIFSIVPIITYIGSMYNIITETRSMIEKGSLTYKLTYSPETHAGKI